MTEKVKVEKVVFVTTAERCESPIVKAAEIAAAQAYFRLTTEIVTSDGYCREWCTLL